jgi:hypothetical protein
VQVVRIINGWAKLARGYGYVHLKNSKDLIKGEHNSIPDSMNNYPSYVHSKK